MLASDDLLARAALPFAVDNIADAIRASVMTEVPERLEAGMTSGGDGLETVS